MFASDPARASGTGPRSAPGPGSARSASSGVTRSSTRGSRSATASRSRTRRSSTTASRVEDGVFIGPNAILTNDRFPRAITRSGELARADDWTVSPILLRTGLLDRSGRGGRGRHGGRRVRDRRSRRRGDPGRPGSRARGRQPGAPHRLGLLLRPAPSRRGIPGSRGYRRRRRVPVLRRPHSGSTGTHASPDRRKPSCDPDLPARHRSGRGGGRPRGPPFRHARDGEADRRLRGGVGRLLRRPSCDPDDQRHRGPRGDPPCARHRPGRRGDHRLVQLQRDRERDPPRRRDARLRGRPRGRLLHRPGCGRGRHHARARRRSCRSTCTA